MLLATACLMTAVTLQAASITVDGINYSTASGNKATVAKYTIVKATATTPADTLFYTGDIVIPEKFTYEGTEYTVVATAANSFLDCKDVTSVTLPATCVTIGRNSFKGCTSLRVSPIPETATNVGSGVFNGCTSLEAVTIVPGWSKPVSEEFANCPNLKRLIIAEGEAPVVMKVNAFGTNAEARAAINSIEYIYMGRNVDASAYLNNEQPFHNMGGLKTLVIGGETTTIQGTTFQGCTALQTVTFEEGNKVTGIGNSAFASCTSLTGIDIPAAVTVIEQSTFNGCRNLTHFTMGDAVTSIGITAFYNTGLTSFNFPKTLTSIGQSAFENSKLSGEIVLTGDKMTTATALTSIGAQAFAGTQITNVIIPASVTSIGQGAFAPIPTLAVIILPAESTNFKLENGVLLNTAGNRLLVTAHEGEMATTYSNATVTSIDNYGLAYAPFTSVDLPALASIGNYGFAYSDIEAYTLEKDVTVRHIPKKPSDMPYSMADTSEGDRLEEILSGYAAVGASVAVIKDGNVAYHYEYGYANKEDKNNPVPVNVNTKYRIASISKVMTSMLAMAETEDGILDLDANLSDLFGYRFYNPKYPSTSLTMRMLLTHTAGLSTEEGLYSESIYAVASGEKYYRAMPGNSFAYSNLGMGIAGAAVEKAADQFLSVYARERFFVPMGIDASYDGSLLADTSLVADCYSNGRLSRTRESMTKPVGNSKTKPGEVFYLGQGNLLISAVDLARVSTILLNEGMYDGRQYLRSDTVQQMLAVHPVNTRTKYEQCIGIRKYAGLVENRTMYYHTGTFYGICALMAIDPSDRSGVIVITSGAHPARGDNTVFNVCNDVLQYCYSDII